MKSTKAKPTQTAALAWCDGCAKHRRCLTIDSGVIYQGRDLPIHLCPWCRAKRTRTMNSSND
jgi:uncharacterized protein CbrC (UPF0167 family)